MITKRVVVLAVMLLVAAAANAQWSTNGSSVYYNGGNVGIGTSTPSFPFQLSPSMSGNVGGTNIGLQIAPTQTVLGALFAGINAQVDQAGGAGTVAEMMGLSAAARNWGPTTVTHAIGARYAVVSLGGPITNAYGARIQDASVSGGGSITNQYGLYIDNQTKGSTANYSIYVVGGLSYLGGSLTVAGDATINGNIAAKYQDVAEWVPSRETLGYGTVVVIDPEVTNHVLASTSAYDTRVAGVISEKPGVMLGEASKEKVLVATTGRVKVKADASQGEIKIGDLLVTSDKPGVAMRSVPLDLAGRKIHQPGTVIGKALEPLKDGQGEILVLLSLQ